MRSAPARLKCDSWPWPSGIDAGMPSAYSRSPRTPKVARAPKPRIDSCVSCARFWRSRASRPGTPRRASETSASAVERSPSRSMVAVEAGVSKAGTVRRRVASTTTASRVVGLAAGAWTAAGEAARAAAEQETSASAMANGSVDSAGAAAGGGERGVMRALSPVAGESPVRAWESSVPVGFFAGEFVSQTRGRPVFFGAVEAAPLESWCDSVGGLAARPAHRGCAPGPCARDGRWRCRLRVAMTSAVAAVAAPAGGRGGRGEVRRRRRWPSPRRCRAGRRCRIRAPCRPGSRTARPGAHRWA